MRDKIIEELQDRRRCMSCFSVVSCTQGIGRVWMCHSCFVLFDQLLAMPRTCFGNLTDPRQRYRICAQVQKSYATDKEAYLVRLEENMKRFIEVERERIKQDAVKTAGVMKKLYAIKDAEKALEEAKKK